MSNIKKTAIFTLIMLSLALSSVSIASPDPKLTNWKTNTSETDKVKQLIKVMPSTSDIMFQMGERYKNLYWAAKLDKWEFAEYQMEEIQGLIKTLIITRPKRAVSARHFLQHGFEQISTAIRKQNLGAFQKAFTLMRNECMSCHSKNNHKFIRLPIKPSRGSSPVLDAE